MRQDNRSKTLPSSTGPPEATQAADFRRPAAGKNRKSPQQRLLAFGEEVVAPVEQRPQGLVAWKGRAASPDEQEEAIVQSARPCAGIIRNCGTASSIAIGMPSRCLQMLATAGALALVRENPSTVAVARSTKRRMAPCSRATSAVMPSVRAGKDRLGIR